jgi:hypothetical protein
MKGTINEIWKHMRSAAGQCSPEEDKGFRAALQYLHFLISKSEQFNVWWQAKQDIQALEMKLKRMTDVEKANQILTARNIKLERLVNNPSIVKQFFDGYLRVDVETEHGNTHVYIQGTPEEIEYYWSAACKYAASNKKAPKHPKEHIRNMIIHYYRTKNFKAQ